MSLRRNALLLILLAAAIAVVSYWNARAGLAVLDGAGELGDGEVRPLARSVNGEEAQANYRKRVGVRIGEGQCFALGE